ncbi:uncharacterized protein C12orf42 homolog [Rhinolophus ferrumequinum]|nr:uncharacterized protein C12orf42 homolog [Rhinolophus ferrumequinum]
MLIHGHTSYFYHSPPSPRHERIALPCSRFTAHMKNFSDSLNVSSLRFLHFPVFPERIQTPVAWKKQLSTPQYNTPRSPPVSVASFEENKHGETSPSPTPSREWDETTLIFTVRQEINKRDRGTPKQASSRPFWEQQMTKKPMQCYSVYPAHLEAVGTHIIRHVRLQNQPSRNCKTDIVPSGTAARPSTAIGLCRGSQTSFALWRVSWSSSETKLVERMAATVGPLANPDSQSRLQGVPGNPVGRGTVAMALEMLPKHPHPLGKRGLRADASLQGSVAGAPLPQLARAPTHLPSKRLIKACSSPPSRPPQRFHTVCSQAPPRPGVNAHLH